MKSDSKQRLERLSRAWKAGVDSADIAARFGYKSAGEAVRSIQKLRVKYPELFPGRRENMTGDRLREVMKKRGLTVTPREWAGMRYEPRGKR